MQKGSMVYGNYYQYCAFGRLGTITFAVFFPSFLTPKIQILTTFISDSICPHHLKWLTDLLWLLVWKLYPSSRRAKRDKWLSPRQRDFLRTPVPEGISFSTGLLTLNLNPKLLYSKGIDSRIFYGGKFKKNNQEPGKEQQVPNFCCSGNRDGGSTGTCPQNRTVQIKSANHSINNILK